MTEAQTKVLNILEGQPDPLTSADIVAISGLPRTEVLKVLNELQASHFLLKSRAGYYLFGQKLRIAPLPDAETKILLLQALAIGGDPHVKRHFVELHKFVREVLHATA